MNKTLNLFVVFATLVSSFAAQAYFRPGWERPIYEANLVELDSTGHAVGIGLDNPW